MRNKKIEPDQQMFLYGISSRKFKTGLDKTAFNDVATAVQ
jgi:hypothetical protein